MSPRATACLLAAARSLTAASAAIALLVPITALLTAGVAQGARPSGARSQATIAVQYEDREIADVVSQIGRAAGQRFVYGDDLRGRISIVVPKRVTPDEALELVYAALYLRGFTVLPIEGETLKVVKLEETASGAPVDLAEPQPGGESVITTLLGLEHASAESVVDALAGYVSAKGVALAYPPTNSVVLAGTESQLRRLITIARIIDRASGESLTIRAIRYHSAEYVAGVIDAVFNDSPVSARIASVWTDDRTNRVIVQAEPDLLREVMQLIDELDQPVEGGGGLHVVRILNRDVEDLARILEALGSGADPGPTVEGAPDAVETFGGALSGRDYSVTVDAASRSLIVRADSETFQIISYVIGELDKLPPRVSVDLTFFQLSRPSNFSFGIDYFLPLSAPETRQDVIAFIQSTPSGGTSVPSIPGEDTVLFARYGRKPLILTFEDEAGNTVSVPISREAVAVQAGEHAFEASVLMRPHIVAISGQDNEIFVGNNVPIPTAASSTATDAQGNTIQVQDPITLRQTINREDVGIRVTVRPVFGQASDITLDLTVTLTDIGPPIAGDPEQVGVSLEERVIETRIPVSPGEYAIIGTAEQKSEGLARRGIPWLMDIPFIGYLFSRVEKRWIDTSILMLVEARALHSPSDDVANSIRRRLAFERSVQRVSDLGTLTDEPYAVLLETVLTESMATRIAEAFEEDGFETRVIPWQAQGQPVWDVYVTGLDSFHRAGDLARALNDAGWQTELTVLSPGNPLAGD